MNIIPISLALLLFTLWMIAMPFTAVQLLHVVMASEYVYAIVVPLSFVLGTWIGAVMVRRVFQMWDDADLG